VIRVFSYGGAEILLREFFTNPIFKQAVSSHLYILDHKKLGLVDEAKPNLNTVRYFKISSWKFIFEYVRFLRHIVKDGYDIVHIHLPVAGWMTIPAKLFTHNTKFIYSEHNLVTWYTKYNYYLIGLAYSFFDCVIYVSHEVNETIKKLQKGHLFKPEKTITILNGVDTNKFLYPHRFEKNVNKKFTVGLVARFRPQKRVDRWIDVDCHTQARAKPPLLNRDVRLEKRNLLGDRDETALLELECSAQQRLKLAHDRPRLGYVVVCCFRGELQCVEQKMWLQLQRERSELGLREDRFQLAALSLAFERAIEAVAQPAGRQDERDEQKIHITAVDDGLAPRERHAMQCAKHRRIPCRLQ